jgi:hypothetical protein
MDRRVAVCFGLLAFLGSALPIYVRFFRVDVHSSASTVESAVSQPAAAGSIGRREPGAHQVLSMTADEQSAMDAMERHDAKCVEGVVYRTYGHVIEPWPGHVRCAEFGGSFGVFLSGAESSRGTVSR